jgi:CxxC motif-containing protein
MSQELICITCPIGCHLSVDRLPDGSVEVKGNRCPRGAAYAREEMLSPKRVVTATCRILKPCVDPAGGAAIASIGGGGSRKESLTAPRRVPCRTTAAFPKERIGELLKAIYALEVPLPTHRGDILIRDALGTGIDVIVTRSID